jgi:predicted NACHT family NTPase
MRILNMTYEVDIVNIFTDVNILTTVTHHNVLNINDFPQTKEEFNRYCLQQVSERNVPGLEAIQRYSSLMILGKPGSGKTTFLKRLALLCLENDSRLDFNGVPFFIPLKRIADFLKQNAEGLPKPKDLIHYLALAHQEKNNDNKSINLAVLESVLIAGRGLILLDGLDEVSDSDYQQVESMINYLLSEYPNNRIVITCRIAAYKHLYSQLTDVEIADFNDNQVDRFVEQWFKNQVTSSQTVNLSKSRRFLEKIKDKSNQSIKELTKSPLMLTLLCLEFSDFGDFPRNRAELYERGIRVMLYKWDIGRDVNRGEIYRNLSLERKIYLLSSIAFKYFNDQSYFFKQDHLEDMISSYIERFSDTKKRQGSDTNASRILKAIEAQHGLLIERAFGVYSFSHLTFQEYFTANYIKSKNNQDIFIQMIENISDSRWNDVFILTVQILPDADDFLMLMKQKVDKILADNRTLQEFLQRLYKRTKNIEKVHKPAATRAFAFDLALNLSPDRTFDIDLDLVLTFAHHLTAYKLTLDIEMSSYRNITLALLLANDREKHQDISLMFRLHQNLTRLFSRIISYSDDKKDFQNKIIALKDDLHNVPKFTSGESEEKWWEINSSSYQKWWQDNGDNWTNRLRKIAMEHRDIGHDLRFDSEQLRLLEKYYKSSHLLIQCLMSDCHVSNKVRDYIENTLLLPIEEIETVYFDPNSIEG